MNNSDKFLACFFAFVVMVTSVSEAQQRQRGGRDQGGGRGRGATRQRGGGGGISRIALLRNTAVQKELELLDDQVAAIQKLQEELRGNRGGDRPQSDRQRREAGRQRGEGQGQGGEGRGQRGNGRGRGQDRGNGQRGDRADRVEFRAEPGLVFVQQQEQRRRPQELSDEQRRVQAEQRQKETQEQARLEKERLAEILLPHQMKRLEQIYIQALGVRALGEPDVIQALAITGQQQQRMEAIRSEVRSQREALRESGDRNQAEAKVAELRAGTDAKTMAVLNPTQAAKFTELKGKPFAIPEGEFGNRDGQRDRGGQREQGGQRERGEQREGGRRERGDAGDRQRAGQGRNQRPPSDEN